MPESINKRFLTELFINKKVRLGEKQYLMYYNRIWPCEEKFIRFLKIESGQDQADQAKKIVARMNFSANFPMPQSFFNNLIEVEEQGDDSQGAKSKGYVGQDHVVHSVNLYILGIYFFFNHPLFHYRLIDFFRAKRPYRSTFEAPIENQTKAFLTAWRYFALCHDIGYVFERTSTQQIERRILDSYNNIEDEILYDLTIKGVSRILFAGMICQRSNRTFDLDDQEITLTSDQQWEKIDGIEIKPEKPDFIRLRQCFSSYFRLANVNSYCGLQQLLPFISFENFFTVIRNKQMKIVAIHYLNKGTENIFYVKGLPFSYSKLKNIWKIGCEEFTEEGYQCEYYISPGVKEQVFKTRADQLLELLPDFVEKRFAHYLTLSPNDQHAEDIVYEIACQIKDWAPFEGLMKETAFDAKSASIIERENSVLRNSLKEFLIKSLDKCTLTEENLENRIKEAINNIKNILGKDGLENELYETIGHTIHNNPIGQVTSSLRGVLRDEVQSLRKKVTNLNFSVKAEDSGIQVFEGIFTNTECPDFRELQSFLKSKAKIFDIEYDELVSYNGVCRFDHGVISAKLLAATIKINQDACLLSSREMLLKSVWPIEESMTESLVLNKDTHLLNETIFSILLHNVYTKTPTFENGISYIQDLSLDPYSYFCTFCDNLQFWGRDQLISVAKASPSNRYHTAQPFDITIEGNTIHIICQTENISQLLQNKIIGMNEFLRDASFLIKITATQSWS